MERTEAKIFGRVQGVFFRASARQKALDLDLAGWVKNENSGSVTVLAEGARENLEKFLVWCQSSPGVANVERIEVKWKQGTGEFDKFEIIE